MRTTRDRIRHALSFEIIGLMLAIPLVLLYELALLAIWFTDRRAAKENAEQAVAKVE